MSTYPRVGQTQRVPPRSRAKCVVCGQLATHRVDVQINWFRGDDIVVKACDEHRKNRYAEEMVEAKV